MIRAYVALAAAAAIAVGGVLAYRHVERSGYERARIECDARVAALHLKNTEALLAAQTRARETEQALTARVHEAETRYAKSKQDKAIAGAAAGRELDRLRGELEQRRASAAQADSSAGAPPRTDGPTEPERELLGTCAASLVDMAGEADRLEVKVVGLQDYVRALLRTLNEKDEAHGD